MSGDGQEKPRKLLPHERIESAARRLKGSKRGFRRWPLAGRHGTARAHATRGMFNDLNAPSLIGGLADIPLAGQMLTELIEMRKLGRSLALSTPVGSAIRMQFVRGVLGNGIEPRPEDEAKLDAWRAWANDPAQCDYFGQQKLTDILAAAVSSWVADGEAVIRFRRGGDLGLMLELVDTGRLPTFRFDGATDGLPKGSEVLSGVVLDKDRRIQGYILTDRSHLNNQGTQLTYQSGRGLYIPRTDLCHIFEMQQPDQIRGISRLIPAAADIEHLSEFSEMALKSARLGARHYAALKDPTYTVADDEDAEAADLPAEEFLGNIDGELMILRVAEEGELQPLPSQFPDTTFAPFVESQLRIISGSVGIPYHRLASDLSGVNYSSGRMGELSFRAELEAIRQMFIDQFLRRVYRKFLGFGEMRKLFEVEDFAMEQAVSWTPLFHADIEPARTAVAYEKLLGMGVMSPQEVIRKLGYDPVKVAEEIKEWGGGQGADEAEVPEAE